MKIIFEQIEIVTFSTYKILKFVLNIRIRNQKILNNLYLYVKIIKSIKNTLKSFRIIEKLIKFEENTIKKL